MQHVDLRFPPGARRPSETLRQDRPGDRRQRAFGCLLGVLLLWLCGAGQAADASDHVSALHPSPTAQRETAVAAARAGDTGTALEVLEALRLAYPNDAAIRLDLAVVAGWAGQDARTVELLEPLEVDELADFVLESYAKAARNLKRWDEALSAYRTLVRRQPGELDFRLGVIMVLADADRFDEAYAARDRAVASDSAAVPAELHLACGYIAERAGRFTEALHCYNQALTIDPAFREARRRRILVASALGAVRQALAEARANPDLLSGEELLRLELDAVAQQVRWSPLPEREVSRAHARAALSRQRELSQLDSGGSRPPITPTVTPHTATPHAATPHAATPPEATGPLSRAWNFDRIVALTADFRMADAVQSFEALPEVPRMLEEVPAYVLAAAGRAYLYLEQPEAAAAVFEAALAQAPDRIDLQVGLFYARSDQLDHEAARDLADRLLGQAPAWLSRQPGRWQPNPDHATALEIAALELAYRDRYGEALKRLDDMLTLAPNNAGLRLSRAELLRWRGWYQTAQHDLDRLLAEQAREPRARVLEAQLAMDTQRYSEAARALADVVRQDPDASATLQLAERWTLHNRPELSIRAGAGRSDGGAFSSRDWRAEGHYYSAPLAYRYRAFVHDSYSYGEFDEGIGRDHRLGAGVEYRAPGLTLRGSVHRGLEQNRASGVAASLRWQVSDRLSLDAGAASNSSNVPLRGTRVGLKGEELTLATTYRWHEARSLSLSGSVLDLDDGNTRRSLQGAYRWRLANWPRHKLLASARAYGSWNQTTSGPYYNPESDRELAIGLTHEWNVYRRYDHGLTMRLGIEAGRYWQQQFGSGSVWTGFLEHAWSLGPRTRLSYGLSTGGRVYDGEREHAAAAFVTLEQRL